MGGGTQFFPEFWGVSKFLYENLRATKIFTQIFGGTRNFSLPSMKNIHPLLFLSCMANNNLKVYSTDTQWSHTLIILISQKPPQVLSPFLSLWQQCIEVCISFYWQVCHAIRFMCIQNVGFWNCIKKNVDYYGKNISRTLATNALHCQEQCQNEVKCRFWTYASSSQACWMKRNDTGRRTSAGATSGPRTCYGL